MFTLGIGTTLSQKKQQQETLDHDRALIVLNIVERDLPVPGNNWKWVGDNAFIWEDDGVSNIDTIGCMDLFCMTFRLDRSCLDYYTQFPQHGGRPTTKMCV